MASNVPEFIMFHESNMDINLVDDPLDPDVYVNNDAHTTATQVELFDVKVSSQEIIRNPILLHANSHMLGNSLKSRPRDVSCEYDHEYKSPKYCADYTPMFKTVKNESNEPSEIMDQDLVKMKAMVSDIKRDPTLIYQAFALPQAKPTPKCVEELPDLTKFPMLPFPPD